MWLNGTELSLSATDLSNFLGCRHRTALDLAVAYGGRERRKRRNIDPLLEILIARGNEHEARYVESLRKSGRTILDLTEYKSRDRSLHKVRTIEGMRSGAEVIVQSALGEDGWFGMPDLLLRVEKPSALGDWSYEIADTKLARETRAGTILQLGLYSEMLATAQGTRPERFYVITPDPVTPKHEYRVDDYAAYFRLIRRRLQETSVLDHITLYENQYPEPVDHCDICPWCWECKDRWRRDDHLSLVAGITRHQRRELESRKVTTLADLAAMPLPLTFKPVRGNAESYTRIREQARLQFESRGKIPPLHQLREFAEGMGLCKLPEPSPGDLFLDLEGDPFAAEGGREYLFGIIRIGDDGAPVYHALWGFTEQDERVAFESVMDLIATTIARHPEMHVYHYAPYEPSAFKRLMGRYATRENELDAMLRSGRFVDLYHVVKQALIAGVERYSIKNLEIFYGYSRDVDLADARRNLHIIEKGLELKSADVIPQEVLGAVEGYNRDDCVSTLRLRDWLESLRTQAVAAGATIERAKLAEGDPSPELDEKAKQVEALRERLLTGVSANPSERNQQEQVRFLVAYILDFHRREAKSTWWEYYRLCELSEEDLFDEPDAITGLEYLDRVELVLSKTGRPTGSVIDRYCYPAQEMEIDPGDELKLKREPPSEPNPEDLEGKKSLGATSFGTVRSVDRLSRTIDIRKGPKIADVHPVSLFAHSYVPTDAQESALFRLGQDVAASGINGISRHAASDLLLRRPPRLTSGEFGSPLPEAVGEYATRIANELHDTVLCIQGPPGAGKTYTGGRMIRALLAAGKKVGITANSHKVICNLLESVAEAPGPPIRMAHRGGEATTLSDGSTIEVPKTNEAALEFLQSGQVQLMGGTSWLWARDEFGDSVDVLFVDEAGQMALPNVLAVSGASRSLVLLGDPQQLDQPQKGSHPDGVNVSALQYMLGDHKTMPEELGLFLPQTWRLHPELCGFTSEMFYEGRLSSRNGLERQALTGAQGMDGNRLYYIDVAHEGNRNSSMEEVDVVANLVERLVAPGCEWTDKAGNRRQVTPKDILVVAPYNAQVTRLAERLATANVRIGTVDKFQGQEAPVVIFSAATSSPEDAPRGMEFLYSPNRLNVATSRAKCAAFLVASPLLFEPDCKTPRQMKLANAFCRYREMAQGLSSAPSSSLP